MSEGNRNSPLLPRELNRQPSRRPGGTVDQIPGQSTSSLAVPAAQAQASWFLICWGFVGDTWRGFKKGVCIVWKAISDAARFVYKKVKWGLEESLVLYERVDSYFIPPQDAWWVNFIREAKIQPLKEVVKEDTRIHMRILWLMVFIFACWNATSLSLDAYEAYKKYPITVTFQPFEIKVGDIPFPSITLSLAYNLKKQFLDLVDMALFNIEETGKELLAGIEYNLTELSTLVQVLRSFCKPKVSWKTALELGDPDKPLFPKIKGNQIVNEILDNPDSKVLADKIVPAIREAGNYCSDVIAHCLWNGEVQDCSQMFKPQLTESGISCVFNKMPVSLMRRNRSLQTVLNNDKLTTEERSKWQVWNLETMTFQEGSSDTKAPKSGISDIPLLQRSSAKTSGATFVINVDKLKMACPQFDSSAPRISISFPLDDNNHETKELVILPNHLMKVGVSPQLIMAHEDIKDISKEMRGCVFSNEEELDFYNSYTQNNCKKECLSKSIRKKFNCSLLSMPNPNGTRLCDFEEIKNVLYSEEHISRSSANCTKRCLPTCSSVSFKSAISTVPLSEETVESLRESFNFTIAVVHVDLAGKSVIAKVRSLRQTFADFAGVIGGLWGMAINMSVYDALKIIFATWFLGPPIFVLIRLILRCLLRIILNVCCCQLWKKPSGAPASDEAITHDEESPQQSPSTDGSSPASAGAAEESSPASAGAAEESSPASAGAAEESSPASAGAAEESFPASAGAAEESSPASAGAAEESSPASAGAAEGSFPASAGAAEGCFPASAGAAEGSSPVSVAPAAEDVVLVIEDNERLFTPTRRPNCGNPENLIDQC